MYHIGELDFGKTGHCESFLKTPGNREKFADWLRWLADAAEDGMTPFLAHDDHVRSGDSHDLYAANGFD